MSSSLFHRSQNRLLPLCMALSALSLTNMIYFGLQILFAEPSLRVQYIPDDAYYYLGLARNFINYKYWTFDSGISVTSGFHLLHAYFMTFALWLFRFGKEAFVQFGVLISIMLTFFSMVFTWREAIINRSLYLLIFLALVSTRPDFLYNSVSITEWPLTLTLAAYYFYIFHLSNKGKKIPLFIIFLVGLFLGLARSDAGLLPFSIWLASILIKGFKRSSTSLAGLLGAILGIALLIAHNLYFTGELFQSSASIKMHWAQVQGLVGSGSVVTFVNILSIFGIDLHPDVFQRSFTLSIISILIFLLLLLILGWKTRGEKISVHIFGLNEIELMHVSETFAALVCLLGYIIFYAYNSTQQQWYTSNFIVPAACLYISIGEYLSKRLLPDTHFTAGWFFLMAIIAMSFNLSEFYPLDKAHSPWPAQEAMQIAGIYLHDHPVDRLVGSWNGGIIGYYEGGHVVNLDGLVNNDAAKYVIDNSLANYLERARIGYIVDFENMLSPRFALRGGYSGAPFLQNLVVVQTFDIDQSTEWKSLKLYEIK